MSRNTILTAVAVAGVLALAAPPVASAQHRGGGGSHAGASRPASPGGGPAVQRGGPGPTHVTTGPVRSSGVAVRGGYYRPVSRGYYFGPYRHYGSYYYSPFYWSGFWGAPYWGWGWGYPGPYYYGYGYGRYGYGYGWGGVYDDTTSVRLQVEPKQTEVFVDGYYVGIVDEFDGVFQRLRLEPGDHEVTLYLAGYRTVTQRIYFQPQGTFKLKHVMEPLPAGAPPEPRPEPRTPPSTPQARQRPTGPWSRPPVVTEPRELPPPSGAPRELPPPVEGPRRMPPPPGGMGVDVEGPYGTLAIRVQPGEAEVIVDGERWQGPDGSRRLTIQLPEGEHRVEVRKAGFEPFTSRVLVRRGETTTLNVSLAQE